MMYNMKCKLTVFSLMVLLIPSIAAVAVDENGAMLIPVQSAVVNVTKDDVFNPHHPTWVQAISQPIHFHRTPPVYADGPFDDGIRPEAAAIFMQIQDGSVFLRIEWTDRSHDEFLDGKRYPDGGEDHIYKEHTENTNQFGDAVCLMLPASSAPLESYPSMMMGDLMNQVNLLFWQAGRGFSMLQAHGRATTEETKQELSGKSFRTEKGWIVIIQIPNLTASTPVCFAVWDGSKQQRDGMKYYSLWYEIQI